MSGTKLYTFLMDWNGGTFISQSRGDNIQEATKGWLNQLSIKKIKTSDRLYKRHGIWKLQYHFWAIYVKKWFGASAEDLYTYYKKHIT